MSGDGKRRKLSEEPPDVSVPPGIDPLDLLMRDWERTRAGLVAVAEDDEEDEP